MRRISKRSRWAAAVAALGTCLPAPVWTPAPSPKPYSSKLTLAGIGQPHFSMGTGGGGSFLRGGTSLLFADMLGDRRLGLAFQAGKRVEDFALQARYTNRASRWTYGVGVELLPYIDAMRGNLAAALDVDVSAISVKGKTNEGVDSMGRGEAMACHAVALLIAS